MSAFDPKRTCFNCGDTEIYFLCRTERPGREGDDLLRRFDPMCVSGNEGKAVGFFVGPAALL
jgi:hypothetical protein